MSVRATAIVRGKVNAPRLRKCAGGFSLIELSFTIIVIALLLGGLLVPLSTQVDQRHYARTEKQLEHIHEALIGFALANRHLPCPAVSATNGSEDRDTSTNQCTKRDGFVPWVTLGVTPADAWNNLIRYSVDPDFARSDPNFFFTLGDKGDLHIHTRDEAGNELDLTNSEIPAVILSHGKNGFGATSSDGLPRFEPAGWTGDERDNRYNATQYYYRTRTEVTTASGGAFDDVITWLSLNQLVARMVGAGRLP
ncbi:MAG: prepilin-type cleavage/methylation domain-containing protein [Betaproteobacteria bacterium]|jgi:type II secretory pathway pseudopilin PulG|nr:MAG: prepilin-type cleavage/methylation domain-containing protein [Betaproteobacteria bacterium]